jgi:hypothetical protein
MHLQIRTSPGSTEDNMLRALEALAKHGINVASIGPDFEAPHVRIALEHEQFEPAFEALEIEHLDPERREAVTIALPDRPGAAHGAMRSLKRQGYVIESVLVLASDGGAGGVRVSFGVRRPVAAGWEAESTALATAIAEELGAGG